MIELFGVGIPREAGTWLFRRVTAGFEADELTFIMSSDRSARLGLLDVAAAASISAEGRAWITGAPVMRETRKAIARRVGIVRPHSPRAAGLKFRVNHQDTSGGFHTRRVGETTSGCKVLIEEGTDRILGAHVLGPHAEEVINLFAVAIRLRVPAGELKEVLFAYPTSGSDVRFML